MSATEAVDFLVVDDDQDFVFALSRALTKRGFTVASANNVAQAIERAKQSPIRKAVVDLKMEGPSGLALIPVLKALHPHAAIVVLTGYSSIATAVEATKLGATNYLCKPATANDILAAFDDLPRQDDLAIPDTHLSVERLEWEHIQKVLQENAGNISATARALGMHRRTLQRKLHKFPTRR